MEGRDARGHHERHARKTGGCAERRCAQVLGNPCAPTGLPLKGVEGARAGARVARSLPGSRDAVKETTVHDLAPDSVTRGWSCTSTQTIAGPPSYDDTGAGGTIAGDFETPAAKLVIFWYGRSLLAPTYQPGDREGCC